MSMCCEKGENMKKNIKKLLTGSIACILAVCIAGCGGSGSGGKAIEIPASFKTAEAEAKEEESKFITFDPILLLDEATSALDEHTEKRLLMNLRQMTDKTVVIVTHRPAALEICDRTIDFTNLISSSEKDL